jgi:hypothetical protein
VTAQSTAKLLDLVERSGWTFVQALAATIYAAGQTTNFSSINWQAALTGAGIAAVIAMLKALGVNASQTINEILAAAAVLQQNPPAAPPPPPPAAARAPLHERQP